MDVINGLVELVELVKLVKLVELVELVELVKLVKLFKIVKLPFHSLTFSYSTRFMAQLLYLLSVSW